MRRQYQNGDIEVIGRVTKKGAELKCVGDKNTPKCSFSLLTGKNKDTMPIYDNCIAWRELAEYASIAQPGDTIRAYGRQQSREYNGKTYTDLVCEWISIAAIPSGAAPIPKPQEHKPTGGETIAFTDVDASSLPF